MKEKNTKKEFNFKQAKRVQDRFKNTEVKVSVTARLDPDIVHWLRKESDRKGLPYQTLMNSILKEVMSGSLATVDVIRRVIREELERAS